MRSSRSDGYSLLEALLCLFILAVAVVPLVDLFGSSHRMTASSNRILDATIHAQTLLEAIAMLEPGELPAQSGSEFVLIADGGGAGGGSGRWSSIADFFNRRLPFPMDRVVRARRLGPGRPLLLTAVVKFERITGEPDTIYQIQLNQMTAARTWD